MKVTMVLNTSFAPTTHAARSTQNKEAAKDTEKGPVLVGHRLVQKPTPAEGTTIEDAQRILWLGTLVLEHRFAASPKVARSKMELGMRRYSRVACTRESLSTRWENCSLQLCKASGKASGFRRESLAGKQEKQKRHSSKRTEHH